MSEKFIVVKRPVKPRALRKVIKDSMYKITIPRDWVALLGITKGQVVSLELQEGGFLVKIGTGCIIVDKRMVGSETNTYHTPSPGTEITSKEAGKNG